MCDGTRKKIDLVFARCGDEKVGILRAGGGKHALNRAVPADSHDVIMLHCALEYVAVFIDDCNIIAFG